MDASAIYVNARFLTQQITGVQRFSIEIARQLKILIPGIKFIAPRTIIHHEIAAELEVITCGKYNGHVWEQLELPFFLKRSGATLLVNLANTAPLFFSRNIITVHDLAFKVNPAWFSKTFYHYYNWLIPRISKRALHLFTVSEVSKKEIHQLLGIPIERISVAYNAVSGDFKANQLKTIFRKDIPEEYILSVASVDPRKNLICLIDAFQQLPSKNIQLCLVGRKNKLFGESNIFALIDANPNIHLLENISDEELAFLYRQARIFVYPSVYEGFGIPNLEAMALKCPVITSDLAVFREVCGDAAWYFNPNDSSQLANKIATLLHELENQDLMKQKGQRQAEKFSWAISAKIYEAVILKYR